jgi:hypothetical protein
MTNDERKAIIEAVPDDWAYTRPGPFGTRILSVRRAVEARMRLYQERIDDGINEGGSRYDIGQFEARREEMEQVARWLDGVDDPRKELK